MKPRPFITPRRIVWIFLVILLLGSACLWASRVGRLTVTLPVEHRPSFSANTAGYPSPLQVSGNRLVDATGQPVLLHGLMAPDPARLAEKGTFERYFYDSMAKAGANVIRIPIHPERWERDPDYLWRYLDPIVAWNADNGVYTILDLHFIGNAETGGGSQMPDLKQPAQEFTLAFWRQVAGYFKDTPSVLFEIFNEPQGISSADWRRSAQKIVAVIRETGARQLILVGGVDYAKELSWVVAQPVAGENIAYTAHIFPAHSQASWDTWFGEAASQYPILLTEWGWVESAASSDTAYLVGSQKAYGEPLMDYLAQHNISWVACWYDDEWLPPMYIQGMSKLNPFGEFVSTQLSLKAK
jgi:aryl-phospho-beta-D-glucosidase BglC (GH1 family)